VGLALGFAFQDLAGNLISGVGLAVHRKWPFKIGDLVETNGVFGKVEKIHLRTSLIRTLDGKLVVVPNKHIYQNEVTNYTVSGRRRVDVECGVSYGENLEHVRDVVRDALRGVCGQEDPDAVEVFFTGFGASSIDLVGRFWIDYAKQPDFLQARSDAVIAVKTAFDEHDITIPFPIRTLDFGIRGGQRLSEEIPKLHVAFAERAGAEARKEAS
jgi:small conductance mechanosensitive channel